MNPDHPRFAEWDAAYVLGALATSDRREFEDHLAQCADCRRAVAELTPTVGLLSRLSPDRAARIDEVARTEEVGPDAAARAGLVSLARERARRRRRMRWGLAAAAVVLIAAAIATPLVVASVSRPVTTVALDGVADVPLEASVALTSVGWGTRIDLDCRYPDVYVADVPEQGWTYQLVVVDREGVESSVSSWRARPATAARLSAGTALAVDDIRSIEIRGASGRVLMEYTFGVD